VSWRHVPAPLLWVPRRAPGGSLAQKMWGADFELWGPDCPLGPGVWRDRIGGKEATCVGTGDWFRDADGYVGVSKADVCYATWGEDIDPYMALTHYTDERTFVIVTKNYRVGETVRRPLWSYRAGIYDFAYAANPVTRNECAMFYGNVNGISMSSGGRPYADDSSWPPCLFAQAVYRLPDTKGLKNRGLSPNNEATWKPEASANSSKYRTAAISERRILSRQYVSSYWLANDQPRDTAILSIASAPGRADPLALKEWAATLPGVIWP